MTKPVYAYAKIKGADQFVHPHSQISAFVIRCLDSIISILAKSKISRLFSLLRCGLSLTWSQMPEDRFSCDEAQIIPGMCGGGLTSPTGKAPCSACPRGSYYLNSTTCQSCDPGKTTRFVGATGPQECIDEIQLRGTVHVTDIKIQKFKQPKKYNRKKYKCKK